MRQTNDKIKIVILASDGRSTNILYNSISGDFQISDVIIENTVESVKFLKQRYKKVGVIRLLDQLFFIVTINKILSLITKGRQERIMHLNHLNESNIPEGKITRVESANLNSTIELIKSLEPDIILVNGTRILSKKLLNSITANIINIHAGITPNYRGVHGAYWAYVNKESHMAGVTLHYLDSGVDTGSVISQSVITICGEDNFATYPLLQLSAGISLLKTFFTALTEGRVQKPALIGNEVSRQWYHPGFFEYLHIRFFKGVK